MTEEQYRALTQAQTPQSRAQALLALFARHTGTLLYGYDVDRHTVHVYAKDGQVHKVVYDIDAIVLEHLQADSPGLTLADLVPNKRLYPAACDPSFCAQMLQAGVSLPFTAYEARPARTFGAVQVKYG